MLIAGPREWWCDLASPTHSKRVEVYVAWNADWKVWHATIDGVAQRQHNIYNAQKERVLEDLNKFLESRRINHNQVTIQGDCA